MLGRAALTHNVPFPVHSMSNSVLLCISTLLDGGNHYSSCHARCLAFYPPHCQGGACLLPNLLSVLVCAGKMFDLVDSVGRKLFESIAITLVCADCLKTEHRKRHALLLCYLHVLTPLLCSQPKSARTSWPSTFYASNSCLAPPSIHHSHPLWNLVLTEAYFVAQDAPLVVQRQDGDREGAPSVMRPPCHSLSNCLCVHRRCFRRTLPCCTRHALPRLSSLRVPGRVILDQ